MAINQGQVLHVLSGKYPIRFWLTSFFWGCHLCRAKCKFTDQCLLCLPESLTHDSHLVSVRCSPAIESCEFPSISVYSTGFKSWLIFPLQTFLSPYYGANLVSAYIIMVFMGIWAFFVAGGSCRSLKLCLLCQDKDFLLYNQRSR